MGWVFLMKSKSRRDHYWCNNALRDCHSNQVWQCKSCKAGKEICQKVCCMFRVFVLLIKPVACSFPQFHHCCACPKLASSIIIINQTILNVWQFCLKNQQLMEWKMHDEINNCMYPHKGSLLSFNRWGRSGWTSRGGGRRGDMPKIPPLSQTSKATPMEKYINGLTLDITVKTDV